MRIVFSLFFLLASALFANQPSNALHQQCVRDIVDLTGLSPESLAYIESRLVPEREAFERANGPHHPGSTPSEVEVTGLVNRFRSLIEKAQERRAVASLVMDPEFSALAQSDMKILENDIRDLASPVRDSLIRKLDPRNPEQEYMVEIRRFSGSDASAWMPEMVKLYAKTAREKGVKVEHLFSEKSGDELTSLVFKVSGSRAHELFRNEVGRHRIEFRKKNGTHTAELSVSLTPMMKLSENPLKEEDLEITFVASGGPGGQNVNKVASAARIRHLPTGIIVKIQEQRDQAQNLARAKEILATKLAELEREKAHTASLNEKRSQVGTGNVREVPRIRTYDFIEHRLTDHRTGQKEESMPIDFTSIDLSPFEDRLADNYLQQLLLRTQPRPQPKPQPPPNK